EPVLSALAIPLPNVRPSLAHVPPLSALPEVSPPNRRLPYPQCPPSPLPYPVGGGLSSTSRTWRLYTIEVHANGANCYECGDGGRSEGGAVRCMDERAWLALSLACTEGSSYG